LTFINPSHKEATMNKLTSFAKRHPLRTFFGLTFALSWAAMVPWLLAGGDDIPWFTFGPMAAALVTAALTGGVAGLKVLLRRQVHWRVGLGWYAVALGLPIALELATVALNVAFGAQAPAWERHDLRAPQRARQRRHPREGRLSGAGPALLRPHDRA